MTPPPATASEHSAESAGTPVLTIDDLCVSFDGGTGRPRVQAVDGATLTLYPRQTVAVVGESGCGKSVTAMSILRLVPSPPARVDRGKIKFNNPQGRTTELIGADDRTIRRLRGGDIAMIFQEPMTSLNPVYAVGDQLVEAIRLHRTERGSKVSEKRAREIALAALDEVGIPDPASRLKAYPHQFSGGMRQRVMIAMALACEPSVLLADEPTTALDVTIQKQILDLLDRLKRERGLGVVLITHDLGVVAQHADVVCVMYAGRVVEYSRVGDLYDRPMHPYTRGLLACIPKLDESQSVDEPLSLVSDVIDDPASFRDIHATTRSGEQHTLIPWWPWHDAPSDVAGETGPLSRDSRLVEVTPGHWVRVWATPPACACDAPRPDLAPIARPLTAPVVSP